MKETSPSTNPLDNPSWKLVAFDLDDTLAPSKSALPAPMAKALRELLKLVPVAVISGGALPQFQLQLLGSLDAAEAQLDHLHLLPTCGTHYLRFENGTLTELYRHVLSEENKKSATDALVDTATELGLFESEPYGQIIEDRGSQITFSALGQQAPLEAKRSWDPTGEKKNLLATRVAALLPDLEVRSGGSTSVDITEKGIDKAYGMAALCEQTGIDKADMLFIGDRLDPDGNDYPVKVAGWQTYAVEGWADTVDAINHLVRTISGH